MNADNIVVINNGEIVEQGSHSVLLGKKGYYHRLCSRQGVIDSSMARGNAGRDFLDDDDFDGPTTDIPTGAQAPECGVEDILSHSSLGSTQGDQKPESQPNLTASAQDESKHRPLSQIPLNVAASPRIGGIQPKHWKAAAPDFVPQAPEVQGNGRFRLFDRGGGVGLKEATEQQQACQNTTDGPSEHSTNTVGLGKENWLNESMAPTNVGDSRRRDSSVAETDGNADENVNSEERDMATCRMPLPRTPRTRELTRSDPVGELMRLGEDTAAGTARYNPPHLANSEGNIQAPPQQRERGTRLSRAQRRRQRKRTLLSGAHGNGGSHPGTDSYESSDQPQVHPSASAFGNSDANTTA
jgi:hypothetical protein